MIAKGDAFAKKFTKRFTKRFTKEICQEIYQEAIVTRRWLSHACDIFRGDEFPYLRQWG